VAGAALLRLQDKIDAGVLCGGAHAVGFVADDGEDIGGRNDAHGGPDHVLEQRLSTNFM